MTQHKPGTLYTIQRSCLFIEIVTVSVPNSDVIEEHMNVVGILHKGDQVVIIDKEQTRYPYIQVLWKDKVGYVGVDDLGPVSNVHVFDEYH